VLSGVFSYIESIVIEHGKLLRNGGPEKNEVLSVRSSMKYIYFSLTFVSSDLVCGAIWGFFKGSRMLEIESFNLSRSNELRRLST